MESFFGADRRLTPRDVCLSAHIGGLCCEEGLGSIEPSHTQPRSASECGLSITEPWFF